MKTQNEKTNISSIIAHSITCTLFFVVICVLQYYYPIIYAHLGIEDSWGEYATFVCYLLASFMIAWAICIDRQYLRPGYVVFGLGLFVIAMEEISWGQRLLGVHVPYILVQHNYQDELTAHNLYIFQNVPHLFYYVIILWALFLPVLSNKFKSLNTFFGKIGMPLVSLHFMPYFAVSLFIFNCSKIINGDEISELLFGVAFILLAIEIVVQAHKNIGQNFWSTVQLRGLSALTVVMLTCLFVRITPVNADIKSGYLHSFAIKRYPQMGLNSQAEKIFQYIIDDSRLKRDKTLLEYGLFLRGSGRQEARSVFLEALEEQKVKMEQEPAKTKPHYFAGKIYKLLGEDSLADKEFKRAIKKDKKRLLAAEADWEKTRSLMYLGETYLELGKDQLALEYFQRANTFTREGRAKVQIRNLIKAIENR